jgi:hypothetical protein
MAAKFQPHEQEQVGCVADMRGNFFDLNPLSKALNMSDKAKSNVYEVAIQTAKGTQSSLKFNICKSAGRQCADNVEDFANLTTNDATGKVNHCIHLSKPQDMPVSYHGYNNMSLLDKTQPSQGVALTY